MTVTLQHGARQRRPRIYLPDEPRQVEARVPAGQPGAGRLVLLHERPRVPHVPRVDAPADGGPLWAATYRAAQGLAEILGLPVAPGAGPGTLRAAADRALADIRPSAVQIGTSPAGSEVWAFPHNGRRVGLVFAPHDLPAVRTVVTVLWPDKVDREYPATGDGAPVDLRVELDRGRLALRVLDLLADEAGPGSTAAAQRDLVRDATADELRAMLGA